MLVAWCLSWDGDGDGDCGCGGEKDWVEAFVYKSRHWSTFPTLPSQLIASGATLCWTIKSANKISIILHFIIAATYTLLISLSVCRNRGTTYRQITRRSGKEGEGGS